VGARDAAGFLIKLASITDAVAEAVKALEKAAPELGRSRQWGRALERARAGVLSDKDVERLRAAVRELARAWEAYPRLLEFLQKPTTEAKDLYYLQKAAGDLGLGEAAEFIALVGAARGVYEMYGERLYQNPLYEALLPYLGWEAERALLRAPAGVHVANRLGERLAREVFSRYALFDLYGDAIREISTLADLPLTVGMPAALKARDVFLLPEKTYPDKVAKYVARWTREGMAEGIRRFYSTEEGIQHRAAAHLMALAGRAVALYKTYEHLLEKARRSDGVEREVLTAVAHAARARAAYEELRIAALHRKYAERLASAAGRRDSERAARIRASAEGHYEALVAEAARRYRESLRAVREAVERGSSPAFFKALSQYLGGAAYLAKDPERLHLLVKAAEPMRLAKQVPELAGVYAKAEEAFRVYRRLEKFLERRVEPPPSPLPDYSVAVFLEG
ncbi:MAG: hypothetical protein ACPL3C_11855, partial [Pyrobaculum sp.]